MSTADETLAIDAQIAPAPDNRQRGFRIALLCALLFHSALLVEANRSATGRRMGDTSGQDDAIAVELVTAADLASRELVSVPPQGAVPSPPPKPETQPEPQPETPPEQAQPEPQPETPPEQKAEVAPPPEPKPPEQTTPEAEQPKSQIPDFETVLQELATSPQPSEETKPDAAKAETAKPAEAKPPEKKAEPAKKKVARATPEPQSSTDFAPAGRGSGVSRPPGITRSGENDAFGLGVIRALRATMPPPTGGLGRVTVRLILNENGDLTDVTVLQSSGVPALDQRVMFATKQTNFPLPPYKSTAADRTFLISYVYR